MLDKAAFLFSPTLEQSVMVFPQKKCGTLFWMGAVAYFLLLWLIACSLGMGLSAYSVSALIWLGTLGMTLHLAWAGSAAIAPAMVWLLALMWTATMTHALPQPMQMHNVIAQVWAASLLNLWVRGGVVILMLAFARWALKPLRLRPMLTFGFIVGLSWSALGTGVCLYSLITPTHQV
jgi:hypothetical protein